MAWAAAPSAPAADGSGQQSAELDRGQGKNGKKSSRTRVKIATTGNRSERMRSLPITRDAYEQPRTVMSLPPSRLPRLLKGDRFRVSSELQLTTNCLRRKRRCNGPPYRYSPRVEVELRIAGSAKPGRGGGTRLLASGREVCGRANREHHCVIVLRTAELPSKRQKQRCAPVRCRINLIATAHHPRADEGARLMVGGLRPDGSIPQDRGRINLVHIRNPKRRDPSRTFRTVRLRAGSVPVDGTPHSVLNQPIRLRRGDQLEVSARLRTSVEDLPYATAMSSQLILAGSGSGARPGGRGARVGSFAGEISERNGFNCTTQRERCTIEKVGVIKVKRKSKRPLHVNLTLALGPKYAKAMAGDEQRLLSGRLQVTRYR